jgi:hypothetical protein
MVPSPSELSGQPLVASTHVTNAADCEVPAAYLRDAAAAGDDVAIVVDHVASGGHRVRLHRRLAHGGVRDRSRQTMIVLHDGSEKGFGSSILAMVIP